MDISVVIPVYEEAPALRPLTEGLVAATTGLNCEILFVDDGSADETPRVLAEIARGHPHIDAVTLPKHLGKTRALKAGFDRASGEVIVTLDSDGQDDPAEIPSFIEKLNEGFDLVCGWKRHRQDPVIRIFASRLYNLAVCMLFRIPLHDVNCGFRAMRRGVLAVLDLRRDYHRLIPVQAHRAGFRVTEIPVVHHRRAHGTSKYGPARYLRALRDVIVLRLSGTVTPREPNP